MPKSSLSYPKVCKHKDGRYYVNFNLKSKRYRLFNGKRIHSSLAPNSYPIKLRRSKAILLADEVYRYLASNNYSFTKPLTTLELFDSLIEAKLKEPLSVSYKKTLTLLSCCLREELISRGSISIRFLHSIPLKYSNNTSYNTTRRHLNVLVNYLADNGFTTERMTLKARKQTETLHKPISDVKELLDEVYKFNKNLHLCCILTYCCLLRPHQEIRRLKWGDFNEDLSLIRLSGDKVKSKRNRLVPVPQIVRSYLRKSDDRYNIFTYSEKPYNSDYFKTLFRRFKRSNKSVDESITLYSFRHSGAIEIFKRTGSISKLQKAMGLFTINVSLTYLRGLELTESKEEELPIV